MLEAYLPDNIVREMEKLQLTMLTHMAKPQTDEWKCKNLTKSFMFGNELL